MSEIVYVYDSLETVLADQPGLPGPAGIQGPQGEIGPPGPGDEGYYFVQPAPLAVWTIPHGLGRYPSVVIIDSAGSQVEGETLYLDANTVQVTFSGPFSGSAQLN